MTDMDEFPQAPELTEAQRRALLPPAAQRALAEADARRAAETAAPQRPTELGGRKGPEPVRFGDWEKKGIAIDFWWRLPVTAARRSG
jgi:hypothetical protein